MKIAPILALLPALYFGTAAAANEYYQVISTGGYYSSFSDIEVRNEYFDKWYPNASKTLKQKLLALPSSKYFAPKVADVGVLVEKFKDKSGLRDLCILNIATNNIKINCDDIKPAEKWQYEKFEQKLAALSQTTFFDETIPGFVLGKTTTTDVLRMELDYAFKTMPANSPNPDILAVDLLHFEHHHSKHMPRVNGVTATKFQMQFVDNTLYKLQVEWKPKVKDLAELRALNQKHIPSTIQSDLTKRFGRLAQIQYLDPVTKKNEWKDVVWVNNEIEIELTYVGYAEKNGGVVVTYTYKSLAKLLNK
jgi:hypothetical protein